MPTVQAPVQLTVEHLLAAIRQLSPAERRELAREFAALPAHNGAGEQVEDEAALLARIEDNSRLPDAEQRRYERLRRKFERRTLTEGELAEYQALLRQLEARNVKRVEAMIALAERRGTTLRGVMEQLGLAGSDDAR
jgi:ferric-dicitrate binding protein FerR (iron transport regulator)